VVAGPVASGKTGIFRELVTQDLATFNVDDRCAELNGGSYQKLPPDVIRQAQRECEQFVHDCIREGRSYLVETTLRTMIAIEQAAAAARAGFRTAMVYVATDDPEIHIRRAMARRARGGRDLSADVIRDIYNRSLENLRGALRQFDRVDVYDNTPHRRPRTLQLSTEDGQVVTRAEDTQPWVDRVCAGTEFDRETERDHGSSR
jgi:predicted ABC-type ATPase